MCWTAAPVCWTACGKRGRSCKFPLAFSAQMDYAISTTKSQIIRGRVRFPIGGIVRERSNAQIRCNSRDQPYSRDGRRCKAPPVGCFLSGIAPAKSFFAGFFIAEKRSVLYADKHPQADTDRDAQRHCLCSDAGGPVPGGHVPEIRAQRRCYYVGQSALGAYDLGSRIGDRILSGDVLGQRDGHPGLCHEHRVLLFLCLHRSAGVQKAPQPERCAGRAGFGQRGHGGADDAVELPD